MLQAASGGASRHHPASPMSSMPTTPRHAPPARPRPGARARFRAWGAWGALVAGCATLSGCASKPEVPPPPPEPPSAAASSGERGASPIVTDVSYVANLFHWVDSLAETSNGLTQPAYYRAWFGRFGPLDAQDRERLAAFRKVRLREFRPRSATADTAGSGCLPSEPDTPSRRQMLNAAAMQATSLPDLEQRARAFLLPEEADAIGAALVHFSERFDFLWAEFDWLVAFRAEFDAFLAEPVTRQWIAAMARFTGAGEYSTAPTLFSFVAVPSQEYGTHAEASERALLLEVRPDDSIAEQVPVIFHELVHDFQRRVPPIERAELAGQYVREGYRGAMANSLLREALPTALGQGLAQLRLAPDAYRPELPWYHLESIDRYAHALLPLVSRAFDSGQRFAEIPPAQTIGALDDPTLSEAPALLFLGEAAFSATEDLLPLLDPLLADVGGRRQWRVAADSGDGHEFLVRYGCLPLAVLSIAGEPPLPGLEGATASPPPLTTGSVGALLPLRRESGAPVLWLYARSRDDVPRVVQAARAMARWPERMVLVRPE